MAVADNGRHLWTAKMGLYRPSEGRGRRFESYRLRQYFQILSLTIHMVPQVPGTTGCSFRSGERALITLRAACSLLQ